MNQYNITPAPENTDEKALVSIDEANKIAEMSDEDRKKLAEDLKNDIAHKQAILEEIRRQQKSWDTF